MEKYGLEGFYLYSEVPNGKGRLTGEIELSKAGSFEAEILDHASQFPRQIIKGHIKREKELMRMVFLKFPPSNGNLANLSYSLQKEGNKHFDGQYAGYWEALPFKVGYNPSYKLYIAEIDNLVCDISDKAEIFLVRK